MRHIKLIKWCGIAVKKIRYTPDREAVYEELIQHLNDRSDYFLEQGLDAETAVEKTLEVMGDAEELAPMLGAIHRPFWGYAYTVAKVLAAALAIVFAVLLGISIFSNLWTKGYREPFYGSYNPFLDTQYEDSYRIDQWKLSGETSFGNYTYSLEECAQWYDSFYKKNVIHTKILVTNFLPWAHTPNLDCLIEGVDNLGNHYINIMFDRNGMPRRVFSNHCTKLAPFVWIYDLEIHGQSFENVEWIEIYSLGNEQFRLRIDIAGGGSQ